MKTTEGKQYTERLQRQSGALWKRVLDMFKPLTGGISGGFSRDLRSKSVAGSGRTLEHRNGHGVGLDRYSVLIQFARDRGLVAFTPRVSFKTPNLIVQGRFDSILLSHLVEHLKRPAAIDLIRMYLHF